ncbi:hypothetical protein CK203_055239 [Vitis vinifera]|uniref:GAG-pre-integrase domain-containing protein n=1 Tax=Vitis vinifera TaxID=29760 RepID=A0A438GTY9_VITVI|nr:hypothetical protein CK203_055239 [Vitis vinifera]
MTFKHEKNVRELVQMKTREGQPLQVQNINYLLLNQNQQILSLPSAIKNILTKEIIGHGTKKWGLYHMDDFSSGKANHARHTSDKERQIWLLYNRLGHPSFRYLQHLFLALFSTLQPSSFKCETSIVAKSHRVPYPPRLRPSIPIMEVNMSIQDSRLTFSTMVSFMKLPVPKLLNKTTLREEKLAYLRDDTSITDWSTCALPTLG